MIDASELALRLRAVLTSILLLGAAPLWSRAGYAQIPISEYAAEQLRLAHAVARANITLVEGLTAAEKFGRPVSGHFKLEGASVRLSIYVKKGDSVYRVLLEQRRKKPLIQELTNPHEYSDAYSDSEGMCAPTRNRRVFAPGTGGDKCIATC